VGKTAKQTSKGSRTKKAAVKDLDAKDAKAVKGGGKTGKEQQQYLVVKMSDVLVSGAAANIDGYRSELERTMIVGEPSPDQRRAFDAMLALQARAIEVISEEALRDLQACVRYAGHLGKLQDRKVALPGFVGSKSHMALTAPLGDIGIPAPVIRFLLPAPAPVRAWRR